MKTTLSALALAAALPVAANAGVLDFTEVALGWQGVNTVNLSNASIVTSGPDVFVATPDTYIPTVGPNGGFCGVTNFNGGDCATDATITFSSAIANLMFQATAHNPGDTAQASIFAGATLLATIAYSANTVIDFTGFTGVTSLFLDDLGSTGAGYVYGDFKFDDIDVVPLPAGLPLLLAGLGGLAALRRKRAA